MFNGDLSSNNLSTEMIQKYLEENKKLILAALEGQNLGKFAEVAQYQAKLQQNLSYLAKLADAASQPQIEPQLSSQFIVQQGQAMQQPHVAISQQQPHVAMSQQQPHVAMSQQQPDLSTLNLPFDLNDQQQQHLAMSLQHDLCTSKLPFQMNEQQHKLPDFFLQQQQFMPGPMGSFPSTNIDIYQTFPTRHGNLSDTPKAAKLAQMLVLFGLLGCHHLDPTSGDERQNIYFNLHCSFFTTVLC